MSPNLLVAPNQLLKACADYIGSASEENDYGRRRRAVSLPRGTTPPSRGQARKKGVKGSIMAAALY
jgi:hypothetical protein